MTGFSIDSLRNQVPEERSLSINAAFTEILDSQSGMQRVASTIRLLFSLQKSKVEFQPAQAFPLRYACSMGDMHVFEKYLMFGALVGDDEAHVWTHLKENEVTGTAIMQIAQSMCAIKQQALPAAFPQISLEEALLTASFIVNRNLTRSLGPDLEYMSKKSSKNAYTLVIDRVSRSVVLIFKHMGEQALLAKGSEKWVYAALTINLNDNSVAPAVVHIPAPGHSTFSPKTIQMHRGIKRTRGFLPFEIFIEYESATHCRQVQKIIQPYIPNALESYIGKSTLPAQASDLLSFVLDVAYALKACHDRNIVHQDLHLGNILIDGDKGFLIDFGLSHFAHETCIDLRNKFFYGYYTSPEHIEKQVLEHGAGPPADMYALGCMLHHLIFGEVKWISNMKQLWANVEALPDNATHNVLIDALKQPELREEILHQQRDILQKIAALLNQEARTREEEYHLIIYQLLHPDAALRLSARGLIAALEALKL